MNKYQRGGMDERIAFGTGVLAGAGSAACIITILSNPKLRKKFTEKYPKKLGSLLKKLVTFKFLKKNEQVNIAKDIAKKMESPEAGFVHELKRNPSTWRKNTVSYYGIKVEKADGLYKFIKADGSHQKKYGGLAPPTQFFACSIADAVVSGPNKNSKHIQLTNLDDSKKGDERFAQPGDIVVGAGIQMPDSDKVATWNFKQGNLDKFFEENKDLETKGIILLLVPEKEKMDDPKVKKIHTQVILNSGCDYIPGNLRDNSKGHTGGGRSRRRTRKVSKRRTRKAKLSRRRTRRRRTRRRR